MKLIPVRNLCLAGALSLAALAVAPRPAPAAPLGHPEPKVARQMVAFRQAGLHGDRAQIPAMIAALQHPPRFEFVIICLVALSQLGATQALPAIDKIIADPGTQPYELHYAQVARARLVAEDAAKNVADPSARAAAAVDRFYQELSLTPEAINAALAGPNPDPNGVEARALDALANMAYLDGAARAFLAQPGVSKLNFNAYPISAIEVRLAPLSRPQRIAALVHYLADGLGTDFPEPMLAEIDAQQLLADEGVDAADAIAARFTDRQAHPDHSPTIGALYRVLKVIGSPRHAELVKDAPDTYRSMLRGEPDLIGIGY